MVLAVLLLIPLSAALVSFLSGQRPAMEKINLASFGAVFLLSLLLAGEVLQTGAVSLWDGFFYADHISALVILLTSSVALLSSIYAVGYLRDDELSGALQSDGENVATATKLRTYYTLTPLFVFSMLLVTLSNNLGVMWVAIEATTLTSIFLVNFYGNVTSLEAAWKYAMIGGVGLAMALFGTVLTYYSGHNLPGADTLAALNWSVLVQRAEQLDHTTIRLAFILVLLGYGTKAGLAPMHTWKPDAYSEALHRYAELRHIRSDPFLHPHQPLPGPRLPGWAALILWHAVHGRRSALHSGAEKSPAPPGLLQHRTRRHHGDGARLGRTPGHAGPDAAHDLSQRGQVTLVPMRR
jgi:hydrogenase-4 component F